MPDIKYLNLNGTTYNITDNHAQEKIETLTTYIGEVKNAQGAEVGSIFNTNVSFGQLIWHNGLLYRTTAPIAYNSSWDANKVVQTTIGDEINSLRGVASETVILTITPASAIPQEGVEAHIYNETTQEHLTTFTFTADDNRKTLGSIQYGDVYTIVMPQIEGYTQPADQTFQAGQMLRDRTVQYVDASISNNERITITASKSDGVAIGDEIVVLKKYDSNGNVTSTTNISINGGRSEYLYIPIGTRYSVTFPTISGYLSPTNFVGTARVNKRTIRTLYVAASSDQPYKFVTKDFRYLDVDADLSEEIANNNLFGVAYISSTLLNNNAAFIYQFGLSEVKGPWTSIQFDIPSANSTYDGQANTASVLDAIAQYEEENDTTITSVFKMCYNMNTVMGHHYFIMADNQDSAQRNSRTYLKNILDYWGSTLSMTPSEGWGPWFSRQNNINTAYRQQYSATTKTQSYNIIPILPIITTTEDES